MSVLFDVIWILNSVLEIAIKMILIVIGYAYLKSDYFKNRYKN